MRQPLSRRKLVVQKRNFILSFEKINNMMTLTSVCGEGLKMQENNRIEFKRKLNDRFERTVVSFLNYAGGGEMIIGVL
jgi:hypothetical protein